MRNHYHLVLETPSANLVSGMAWLQSTYTIRLNHRNRLFGHVFSGRYKAQIVEGGGNGYLRTACDYVHQISDWGAAAERDNAPDQGDRRPSEAGHIQERQRQTAQVDGARSATRCNAKPTRNMNRKRTVLGIDLFIYLYYGR
jgi:hypothetical protein